MREVIRMLSFSTSTAERESGMDERHELPVMGFLKTEKPQSVFLSNAMKTVLWMGMTFGALLLFWFLRIRNIYVEEQFSEIASSARMFHPHFVDWFIKPFSLYRMDYPDWNTLYRSFIRPSECAQYYLLSILFGSNYSCYLFANYFYQAGTCALTFYIAAEILGLDSWFSHLAALVVFVSPAYGQQQLFLISFAVDPMAGFFIVAAVAFYLKRCFLPAWLLIVVAVGAKEPAWPVAIVMGLALLRESGWSLLRRLGSVIVFCAPVMTVLVLRAYAFGLSGALSSDEGGGGGQGASTGILRKLLEAVEKWPFGVLAHSQQYDPWILSTFRVIGFAVDALVWATILTSAVLWIQRAIARRGKQSRHVERVIPFMERGGFSARTVLILAGGSLVFPLRFNGDPRYGAATYPLVLLGCGIVVSLAVSAWKRFVAMLLVASIGLYGLTLRISDLTHGRDVFRSEWELVAGYRESIKDAGSHPLFVVDDATGGEINSEAIQRFYGPQTKVIRVNDLFKDRDCLILTDKEDLPIHIAVNAWRGRDDEIHVHSVITGCGAHNFLGVPRLPQGPLVRSGLGFRMRYELNPRMSPQPTSGMPRVLDVVIENAPADAIIVAPDLRHRRYTVIPIS
jgi:hypothetical protein